ncbi:MAG: polyamine aminopropyltransferase [Balneolaceae bacterium]
MSTSFYEYYHGQTGLAVGVKAKLFSEQTEYQLVEVFETDTWGNLLVIDGMVMLSEQDEFVYHEMLSHTALFTHPDPKRVLIIGGGDGGTAREVMKHPGIRRVDMVEIDEAVVRASKKFLPDVGDFDNPKLKVHFEDGISFVQNVTEPYDLIIVDGSDPEGPAEGLFARSFIEACYQALSPDGVLSTQTESPWIASYHPSMNRVYGALESLFQYASPYLCYIPLYPSGMWSMICASKRSDPTGEATLERSTKGVPGLSGLKYYNPEVHLGAFALPDFVRTIFES